MLGFLIGPAFAGAAYLWARNSGALGGKALSLFSSSRSPTVPIAPGPTTFVQPAPVVNTPADAAIVARNENAATAAQASAAANTAQAQAAAEQQRAAQLAQAALDARRQQEQAAAAEQRALQEANARALEQQRLVAEQQRLTQAAIDARDAQERRELEAQAERARQLAAQEETFRATAQAEAARARAEAERLRQAGETAANAARAADQERQRQAELQRNAANAASEAAQRALDASRAAQQAATNMRDGAVALRTFLLANPTPAAFGYRGHPSPPVRGFQKIAAITEDGIVGEQVRAAGRRVNVEFPPRPSGAQPAPRPAPGPQPAPQPDNLRVRVDDAVIHSNPAPAPAPTPHAPDGYDPTLARQLAQQVSTSIRNKRYGYDRQLTARFQRAAGLPPDSKGVGLYGGATRGALVFYGVSNAPGPLFAPTQTIAYRQPV